MKCSTCRAENLADSSFCSECGAVRRRRGLDGPGRAGRPRRVARDHGSLLRDPFRGGSPLRRNDHPFDHQIDLGAALRAIGGDRPARVQGVVQVDDLKRKPFLEQRAQLVSRDGPSVNPKPRRAATSVAPTLEASPRSPRRSAAISRYAASSPIWEIRASGSTMRSRSTHTSSCSTNWSEGAVSRRVRPSRRTTALIRGGAFYRKR